MIAAQTGSNGKTTVAFTAFSTATDAVGNNFSGVFIQFPGQQPVMLAKPYLLGAKDNQAYPYLDQNGNSASTFWSETLQIAFSGSRLFVLGFTAPSIFGGALVNPNGFQYVVNGSSVSSPKQVIDFTGQGFTDINLPGLTGKYTYYTASKDANNATYALYRNDGTVTTMIRSAQKIIGSGFANNTQGLLAFDTDGTITPLPDNATGPALNFPFKVPTNATGFALDESWTLYWIQGSQAFYAENGQQPQLISFPATAGGLTPVGFDVSGTTTMIEVKNSAGITQRYPSPAPVQPLALKPLISTISRPTGAGSALPLKITPGGLFQIDGTALCNSSGPVTAAPPWPAQLGGCEVDINNEPAALQYVSNSVGNHSMIQGQWPVDLVPTPAANIIIHRLTGPIALPPDSSPLYPLQIVSDNPSLFPNIDPPLPIKMYDTDHSYRLVTDANPATPGENIEVYGQDFGGTTPSVPAGVTPDVLGMDSSGNPILAMITAPIDAFIKIKVGGSWNYYAATVTQAVALEGAVGIAQIDLRLPDVQPDSDSNIAYLTMRQPDGRGGYTYLPSEIPFAFVGATSQ